jgi:alpha-beta hydrolase superfamily lysophospholipase
LASIRQICALILLIVQASCAPSIVPAGDAIRQPAIENDRYIAPDGTSLQLAVWPAITDPEKLPKAVILGIHGFGDYRNAWQQPAEIWARESITTFAYDQRGFGSSPTRGRWAGTQTLVDDIKTMSGLLRSRYPGVPLYLAGESMGGALVLVASDNHLDVDGIILVAAAVRSRDTLGPVLSAGISFFAHVVPWLPSGPTSIDFQLTDNPEVMEKFSKDPLVLHNPRMDLAYGLFDAMDAAKAAAPNIGKPYIMVHGLSDRLVPLGPVKAIIEVMPRRDDSHLAFYATGYHMLLRDKKGSIVTNDLAAWIADKYAPLPSGADAQHIRPELATLWGTKRSEQVGHGRLRTRP